MLKPFKKIFQNKKYNVLVFGSNQLNNAIAKKIKESPFLNELYVANASEAIKKIGINIPLNNEELIKEAKRLKIDIFICNDVANIQGIIDSFTENGIYCFGVNKRWTMLEASKHTGKQFTEKYNIKHPKYSIIQTKDDIENNIKNYTYPVVIKANGYATGTGVFICNSKEDVIQKTDDILQHKIHTRSKKVIMEEFILGKEISYMQFWDGKNLISFPPVKDFKKRNNNDEGPNTGGMASFCPYTNLTEKEKEQLKNYDEKMKQILKKEKADFSGIIYSGVIFKNEELYILEYNMRFGCPEGIALLSNLESDFLELLLYARKKQLNKFKLKYKNGTSFALSITCLTYPYENNDICRIPIKKIKEIENNGINVLYGNGQFSNEYFEKNSSYVMVLEKNSENPFQDIYKYLEANKIENAHYRTDIDNIHY